MDLKTSKAQPLSVLVVEDEDDLRDTLIDLLESLELFSFVIGAKDGKEAVMKISNQKFDIVLTDLRLPRLDGLELTAHIRRVKAKEDIKIFLMSGSLTTDDVLKAKDIGVNSVLAKPFSLDKFKEVLVESKKAKKLK